MALSSTFSRSRTSLRRAFSTGKRSEHDVSPPPSTADSSAGAALEVEATPDVEATAEAPSTDSDNGLQQQQQQQAPPPSAPPSQQQQQQTLQQPGPPSVDSPAPIATADQEGKEDGRSVMADQAASDGSQSTAAVTEINLPLDAQFEPMPAPPNDDEVATKEPCRMPARSPAGSVDLLEEDDDEEDMVRDSLREDVICMIFDLPKSTKFYRDFSCAIASKFAMHGRMYPTSTHVCFYSNVFGRERKILMPYDSIAEIAKTTTMMIQNAIRITTTAGDDYTFTSFWGNNRDRCFSLIVRIRNRALGLTVSPTSSPSISPMSDPPETPSSEIGPLNDDTSPREVESKPLEPEDENRTSIVADVGLAAPKDISMTQVLEETFNVSVDKFLDSFILDGAPFGLDEFNRRIGSTELECDPWTQSTDGEESVGTTRSLSFRVPIEAPIGPKSSMVNALQFLMPGDHGMHIIETSTRLVDIPYGDYFSVEDRWTVVPNRGNPNSCTLLIEMKLEFSKSTFWKSKIEQRAKADNKDKFLKWIAMAKEHLESAVVPTEAQQQRSPAATHKKDLKKQDSRAASPRKHARHAQPMASQPKAVRTGRRQLSIRDVGNSLTEKTTALGVHAQEMMTSVERGPYFWKAFPWFIVVILLSVLLQLKASLIRIEDTLSSTTSELRMLQEQVHLLSQIAAQASSRGT